MDEKHFHLKEIKTPLIQLLLAGEEYHKEMLIGRICTGWEWLGKCRCITSVTGCSFSSFKSNFFK
jgi:hypothetical protein